MIPTGQQPAGQMQGAVPAQSRRRKPAVASQAALKKKMNRLLEKVHQLVRVESASGVPVLCTRMDRKAIHRRGCVSLDAFPRRRGSDCLRARRCAPLLLQFTAASKKGFTFGYALTSMGRMTTSSGVKWKASVRASNSRLKSMLMQLDDDGQPALVRHHEAELKNFCEGTMQDEEYDVA